jgi:4-hydroxybenzoate polyprenyltransferase
LSNIELTLTEQTVTIGTNKKWVKTKLLLAVVAISSLLFIAPRQNSLIGVLYIVLIIGVVCFLTWQLVQSSLYPISVIDFQVPAVIRKPAYPFFKEQTILFDTLTGVSVSTRAIGGGTSAYEDGNTDYEKTLILETNTGKISILSYTSRTESIEDSLQAFTKSLSTRFSLLDN